MYIKEVHISGFRSYRETIVSDFSPKHNVVVGRNGSGKSNFFFAIQFVLSDEFNHLKMEQRQGLIHEGTGERVTIASVEIVFDNSDHRIVAIEGNEVRVLRRVSLKKDQYFIDSKMVTRTEVVNLMESAGFSRSNPYYIVKQGKINELATAPDSHRLKLLREVAGTRVYDERKEESLKILRDTSAKSEKIEVLLSHIEERLKTLEEEKDDLKEYQKWDKMKRSVEYTIYDNELKEARRKLDKLGEQREELNVRQSQVTSDLLAAQNRAFEARTDQRKLETRFKGMREEKEALLAEQTERFQKKTELELLIKDLREDVEKERSGRDNAEHVLGKLKADIIAKEEELQEIVPKYNSLNEEAAKLNTDIRIMEQRCKELYAKQGYHDQYKTVEERDKALMKEIRFYDRQLDGIQDQISAIELNLQEEEIEEQQLQSKIMESDIQAEECVVQMSKLNQGMADLRRCLDQAIVHQQEAARDERNVRDDLESVKMEVQQAEQDLRRLVPRSIMNGVDSVQKVLEHFRANNDRSIYTHVINGYRGTLIELFECESVYYQAVEVVTGNRLFYHVVDDDSIAMKILKEEARPILDHLQYHPNYESVFTNIFGRTAIVRNMKAGNRLAKTYDIDCVTFEGDQVSKRGEMTGGYLDEKRSRMRLFSALNELTRRRKEIEVCLEGKMQLTNAKTADVEKVRMQGGNLEREIESYKEKHRAASERKRHLSQQLQQTMKNKEPKVNQCVIMKNRIRELQANKEGLQRQLETPLLSQLSDEEQQMLNDLQEEIKQKRLRLETVNHSRAELESIKHRLDNQLTTNLLRKRESLQAKIHDISVDEKRNNLLAEMAELKLVTNRMSEVMTRLADLEVHLAEYEESQEKLSRDLEDCQEQQKDLEAQISEFSKQVDLICTKQSAMQAKREDVMGKIKELGSLPMDAKQYDGLPTKVLEKKLGEALEKLKKYENVNKRALDQYVQASDQKEDLTKRMQEHIANQKAINELLSVLEHRKYEAIQLTFKQVSKNFHTVFERLVPGGEGHLVMRISEDSIAGGNRGNMANVDAFCGVGIKVSFTGSAETREMQQLSGGQKSLVALGLIFAIQKCDPAPFYLFDEIDAALDAQHRKAVADMIHELSEHAQFITTTFRAELLDCAEKYYGVHFRNKVSHIDVVSKEQAFDFVEDDQTHG